MDARDNKRRSHTITRFLALEGVIARLREIEIAADAVSLSRLTGALIPALLVLLFLSGSFMAFYYSPAPGAAYDSVDFSQFSVPFGGIIRGVHHYGWNLLLIAMGLHLLQAFVLGAYKAPRQMVWVSGVLVMLFVPLFIITGDLLPWNQKGYWSTQVRLSIIESVPLIGDLSVRLLQGSPFTGIVALTRFYVLHILFLPGLLLLLVLIHLLFVGQRGLSDPLYLKSRTGRKVRFFPNMINRWLILFFVFTVALGLIAHHWPVPLGDPADPTDSGYIPKPEWWVLFLNQLVTIFRGPLAPVGAVLIPGMLAGLLIALPFLDRSVERDPFKRPWVMISAAIIILVLLGLSLMGYFEHFGSQQE